MPPSQDLTPFLHLNSPLDTVKYIVMRVAQGAPGTLAPLAVLCVLFFGFFFFCLFRAAPVAYGSSQLRGQIGATAVGLHPQPQPHQVELHLRPTPQLTAAPAP